MTSKIFILLVALILSACVELRLSRRDKDGNELTPLYIGKTNKTELDTRLGSRNKLWLVESDSARIYVGSNLKKNKLTIGTGIVYYPCSNISIEIGTRRRLVEIEELRQREEIQNTWEDSRQLFFIGGKIRW